MANKTLSKEDLQKIARDILEGRQPDMETYLSLLNIPDENALWLCPGADMLREASFGRGIHLCVICNGKSGRCSEDCTFCSQSAHGDSDIEEYPLMSGSEMAAPGKGLEDTPVNRYSIVTSGRRLSVEETKSVADGLSTIDTKSIQTCASLGTLDSQAMTVLKEAGVSRYHHNLETAESYFHNICTTHSYQDRIDTIKAAREAGLSICSGGILGMGETNEQIAELAFALKELDVDAVPLNFFVPVEGVTGSSLHNLTPLKCIKIIAFFRHVLPKTQILICGGRQYNLKDLHALVFYAGASGIMTGNYLTTEGRNLDDDLKMLEVLGLKPQKDMV